MDAIFHTDTHDKFENLLQDLINNICYVKSTGADKSMSIDLKAAREDLENILLETNYNINNVPDSVEGKGWDPERVQFFVKLLNEKKTELLYSTLLYQNSAYGEIIVNFDWVMKLVLGTSELNSLKYPLMQLHFSTLQKDKSQSKLMYELNKEQLLKTIQALENVITK